MTCRIILVSHGLTRWNLEGRIQGHTNVPLNTIGWKMAGWLAHRLSGEPLHAIYTSDLVRAFQTAVPTARQKGLDIITDTGLREGRTFLQERSRVYPTLPFPDEIETRQHVLERMTRTLSRIAGQHDNETLLAVTHNAALEIFIRSLPGLRNPGGFRSIRTAIHRLAYRSGRFWCVGLNKDHFLKRLSRHRLDAVERTPPHPSA